MVPCGYKDCDCSEPISCHSMQGNSPTLFLCPCEKQRLLLGYEHVGTRPIVPFGQRYDTQTGQLLYSSIPAASHFAGASRGGQFESFQDIPLPERKEENHFQIFPPTQITVPNTHQMSVSSPPILAGRYLIHRAWSGDRYFVWSLTSGTVVHCIEGNSSMGLGASPVWDGCGIGMFVAPQRWERYVALPDFNIPPTAIDFPSPVCDHAAPMIVYATQKGKANQECRFLCTALVDGLALLPLNSLDLQKPEIVYLKKWSASKEYLSPVWFDRSQEGLGSAIVTAHPKGSIHIVYLSDEMQPVDEACVECLENRGSQLFPPVVTAEGMWLIRQMNTGVEIACAENPNALRDPLTWKSIPLFSPIEDAFRWTPFVLGHVPPANDPRPFPKQPRIVLLGRNHFLDLNQYRLTTGGIGYQPIPNFRGSRIHPAMSTVFGNHIVLGDHITGNLFLYSLPHAHFKELSPLGTRLKDLIGGPVVLGNCHKEDSRQNSIVWPTRFGLHVQSM